MRFAGPPRRRPFYLALALAAVLAAPPVWAYRAGVRGLWLDSFFSDLASRQLKLPVQLLDARLGRLSDLRFGAGLVQSRGGKTLAASGPGRFRLDDVSFSKDGNTHLHFWIRDLALLEDLYRRSKFLTRVFQNVFDEPIYVRRLEGYVSLNDERAIVHLVRCNSDDLVLVGGLRLENGRVAQANLLVLVPERHFENLPKELRARMIRRAGGWRGVRLTFVRGQLTVYGSTGPFFRARWH